jgi:hypothetical protein
MWNAKGLFSWDRIQVADQVCRTAP